jgi:hypothetical protein
MADAWYCRIDNQEVGPCSPQELAAMAQSGRLKPIDFVRKGVGGSWVSAGSVQGLSFGGAIPGGPAITAPSPPPPPLPAYTTHYRPQVGASPGKPIWPWVLGGVAVAGLLGFIMLIVLVIVLVGRGNADSTVQPQPRVHVAWQDGTAELQAMVSELTPEQAVALGLVALFSGKDVYAARVRIANTGNIPVRVFPQNIRIHLGNDSVAITTSNDPRFLQATILQPGSQTEGLVMYQANILAGASVRLGAGGLSYSDATIEVTY